MSLSRLKLLALLVAIVAPSFGVAEEEVLAPGFSNGIPFLSGGIGDEEREAIERARKDYNVKIVLTETAGAYISNVNLEIATILGEPILALSGAGPLVLIQLPPGTYLITADYDGRKTQRSFDVKDYSAQTVVVAW